MQHLIFTSLFNISHGHAVGLFFEKFFEFNYNNIFRSEANFDLNKRFNIIFDLFETPDIKSFNSKNIINKKRANLEDNLYDLNIDINKRSEEIISGINILRLGNNPVKINEADIYKIISGK